MTLYEAYEECVKRRFAHVFSNDPMSGYEHMCNEISEDAKLWHKRYFDEPHTTAYCRLFRWRFGKRMLFLIEKYRLLYLTTVSETYPNDAVTLEAGDMRLLLAYAEDRAMYGYINKTNEKNKWWA